MLRIGVIGTGDIAQKSYLSGLNAPDKGFVLQAVCDAVPGRAEEIAAKFGAAEHYVDVDEMLARTQSEFVIVLTPLLTHAAILAKVLRSGRHAYSEKPAALTLREAEALCDLADRQGRTLLAAPLLMLYPAFRWLEEVLAARPIGQLTLCRAHSSHGGANRGMWATDSGSYFRRETAGEIAPLYDMAVYALTVLTYVVGPVRRVTAFADTAIAERRIDKVSLPGFEPYTLKVTTKDNSFVLLDFGGGAYGAVDASFCMPYRRGPEYEFYGDAGALEFNRSSVSLTSELPAWRGEGGWHEAPPPDHLARVRPEPVWGEALGAHMVDLLGGAARPRCGGRHAAHVIEIMEKIAESVRTGAACDVTSRP